MFFFFVKVLVYQICMEMGGYIQKVAQVVQVALDLS